MSRQEHGDPLAAAASEPERAPGQLERVASPTPEEARLARELSSAHEEIERLRAALRVSQEHVRYFDSREIFRFARTVASVKGSPSSLWRIPIAAAMLATPRPIRERIRRKRGAMNRRVDGGRERLAKTAAALMEAAERAGDTDGTSWRCAVARLLSRTPGVFLNEPWTADAPLVSVVITCFNYGQYVADAVESVARQTWKDLEIIVVEGGSTDGTTVQRVHDLQHPRLRKIFQQRPTRVGDNRLRGLEDARGKFVVFLDADDLLEPTYVEKAVMALELTGADLAYPSVRLFGNESWVWETADRFTLHNIVSGNSIATVAMFRKETWRRLGIGYGTHVTDAIEDWEFWLRFAERGATGVKIREPLMLYRVHGKSFTDRSRANQETSRRSVLEEHRPYLSPSRVDRVSRRQERRRIVARPQANLRRADHAQAPLRIAIASPFLIIGGSDNLMREVFADHAARGAQLTVYTTAEPAPSMGSSAEAYRALTPDVFELPNEVPAAAQPEAIVHLLRSRRINVLLVVGSSATYELLPRLRRELPDLRVIDQLYNAVGHLENNRLNAGHIDLHLVQNEEMRRTLVASGEPRERVRVIHGGIDLERFALEAVPRREQGFDSLPLRAGQPLVLFAGRLSPEKGPLRFVEIARRLRGDDPRLAFAMIGDGPERDAVEARVRALRLQDRVTLLGFVEAAPYLRRADVVVMPSDAEGLPLVCLEALALGTPVVASAVGTLPEVIVPGRTGALLQPDDVEGFADAVKRTLALDPDRARLAATCRASVAAFDIRRIRDEYFDAFRSVAGVGVRSADEAREAAGP